MKDKQSMEELQKMIRNLQVHNKIPTASPLEIEYEPAQDVNLILPPYGRFWVGCCASSVSFFGIRFALYVVLGSIGGPSTFLSLAIAIFLMVGLRQAVVNQNQTIYPWLTAIATGFILSQVFSGAIIYSNPEVRQLFLEQQIEDTKSQQFQGISGDDFPSD